MTKKKAEVIILTTLILSLGSLAIIFFWVSEHFETMTALSAEHTILVPFLLVSWRVLAIIIPPIPGATMSLALLPILGWFKVFIYTNLGILIGTSTAFFLARHFREPLVHKFMPLKHFAKWQSKISEETEFVAFLGIRLATGPIIDFVSYIAGLSKISFTKFFLATLVSILPDAFIFYVGETIYHKNVYLAIGLIIVFMLAFYVSTKKHLLGKKLT